jgi:DNA polymerase-1
MSQTETSPKGQRRKRVKKLVLIDGNSIMNRAFYGIMGSKMLMTKDGKYTNAVYGFLAILFKLIEDENPDYMAVAFDLKAPTARHKMYEGYKATRKGMPDELAEQMPVIKEILRAMKIDIIEKEGYEADDVLGTLSCYGEKQGLEVIILSGDRDTFQLATDQVTIRIPRTKGGKTETDCFDREKIKETYGLEPKQLIEVKGLQGDSSDNIPGVPGIGEKTALSLIQKYGSIQNLYDLLAKGEAEVKGKQKENLENNQELAELSRTLGTINLEVPIEDTLEQFKVEEWDKQKVYEMFKELNFKRYIERFHLAENKGVSQEGNEESEENNNRPNQAKEFYQIEDKTLTEIINLVKEQKEMIFYLSSIPDENAQNNPAKIISERITSISIYNAKENKAYYQLFANEKDIGELKEILEDASINKIGFHLNKTYILLKQVGITLQGLTFDAKIAGYLLDPTVHKLSLIELADRYLEIEEQNTKEPQQERQINLFDQMEEKNAEEEKQKEQNSQENQKNKEIQENTYFSYLIAKLNQILTQELEESQSLSLFETIEMPTVTVLADMQWNGIHANQEELTKFGEELTKQLEQKTKIIYEMAGEEFNINSTKQLGEILFEKMKLPVGRKTKSGYSTDVDVLEKLKQEDPIIQELLDYRQLMKLNSTYVEGLKPYINPVTKRIHSFFHQTITATGRISSTEPNLQNIPTRFELGKQVRKIFEPEEGNIFIDADYSQIELRVLADMSNDKHMIEAFQNNQDIHKQAASKVFKTPIDQVTKEQRSNAKAVNFGIVYGISDFGLAEQLGIPRKLAKTYIEEYLEEYAGVKEFMENMVELAKKQGYVETLFHRRRYIPELTSKNYTVRQFGSRAAMNSPIQGTAADIMKIAMINVLSEIQKQGLKSRIILQVHDEMMIESPKEEAETMKKILKECMEKAATLKVPLLAEISEATNWYDCK